MERVMEEVHNSGCPISQASPQPYGIPRDIIVWYDKYNSTIMSGSVHQATSGISLSAPNLNKKYPNKRNLYQEMLDNMKKNIPQLSISQSDLNPPKTPITQNVGQGWFPPQECKLSTNQDSIFKTP